MTRLRRILPFVLSLAAVGAQRSESLEVTVYVASGGPGAPWYWSIHVDVDRVAVVEVLPKSHLSRRFTLSPRGFSDLQALIVREDFLSLPERVGALVVDGPGGEIVVDGGSRKHRVHLASLPYEFRPIWRTDVGPVGRAYRVCEHLRVLTGLDEISCPGVPDEEPE